MLITARDILRRVGRPSEQSVRHELSGQICRCTGYANIVKAIVAAGQEFSAEVMAQPMQGREHG
jgi:aerobic carbon-monoxide dehydrogenase small subunit